jgi:hypothetical protein
MPYAADWSFPPPLLRAYRALFLNRSVPYAAQEPDGSYRWVQRRARWLVIERHLLGLQTVALSSLDRAGWCRWVCLDADAPGALPQLVALAARLTDLGFVGVCEASRRGGHYWLFLDAPAPASLARRAVRGALAQVAREGGPALALEVYPEVTTPGALGHAVRLPLGVHQKSGQRYPLLHPSGAALHFGSVAEAMAHLVQAPKVPISWLRASWGQGAASPVVRPQRMPRGHGTRSPVIAWVDASISPLDLLAEYAPDARPRPSGRGVIAFCPFHDDRGAQADGSPGTPSLYLVHDARSGWSWRCLSTNCAYHEGPLKHAFRLWLALTGLEPGPALRLARERWPQSTHGL